MSQQGQTSGRSTVSSSSFPLDTWVVVKPNEYLDAGVLPERDVKKKANHIICVDGTSNNQIHDITINKGQVTNVGRISHLFTPETKSGVVQQVLYQPGIGSVSDCSQSRLRLLDNMFDQAFGGGFETYIVTLYRYICQVYKSGDKLFFFGFSRGAYVARVLASMVADVGVLDQKKGGLGDNEFNGIIMETFNAWRFRPGGPASKSQSALTHPATIEFLGVFDTVASLGLPDVAGFRFACNNYEFAEEVNSRPSIKRIFQAAALTEHRENFKCVLYKRKHQAQVLGQVWFPGSHESVGGGNGDPGNTIPYVTLIWMVAKFRGLLEINDVRFRRSIGPEAGHIPCDDVVDSKSGIWLANTDHYRTELGSGVNEKRHRITEQPYFTQYTGIPELPDVDGSDYEPIRFEKLKMDEPDDWEKKMLDVMEKHVDGVRGWLADRYHHLHHHTLHGITHAPNLTDNGRYTKTQSTQAKIAAGNGKAIQPAQKVSTQQTQIQKTSQPAVNAKDGVRKVEAVRRVQTGLKTSTSTEAAGRKQQPGGMRRVQTLPAQKTQGKNTAATPGTASRSMKPKAGTATNAAVITKTTTQVQGQAVSVDKKVVPSQAASRGTTAIRTDQAQIQTSVQTRGTVPVSKGTAKPAEAGSKVEGQKISKVKNAMGEEKEVQGAVKA